jgi:hypothetical protein
LILSLKVADETYEKYGRQNTKNPREPIERVIEKYADIGSGKVVILTGEPLAALQKLIGQIDEPQQIALKVEKIASIQIGGLTMPLSESQLKHIKDYSAHQGITPSEYAVREVQKALRNALGV